MARPTTSMIYMQKVVENARRCLKEATLQRHPYAEKKMKMRHPISGDTVEVMSVELAVEWAMEHHLPSWSQSSWKLFRAGYKRALRSMLKAERISDLQHKTLVEKMYDKKGMSRREAGKIRRRKKKVLQPKHLEQMQTFVDDKKPTWGEPLMLWMYAAVATGLRPNEWLTAEWINDEETVLRCENFKYNDERSYASHREIDLSKNDAFYLDCVRNHLKVVKGFAQENASSMHYKGCARLLRAMNDKLWPRRNANVTLYTGRHQFSANAKSDETVSEVRRAALMGHKTTKTSRERYGKGRYGSKGMTPEVNNQDVLKLIKDPPHKRPGRGPDRKA